MRITEATARRELVTRAITRLTRQMQLILSLRHRERLGFGEIAEVLELPIPEVKSLYQRAISDLRKVLEH